jgi:hypothetical protein
MSNERTRAIVLEQVAALSGKADTVVSVWDTQIFPLTVGGLLIGLQEILMLRALVGARRGVLCVISPKDAGGGVAFRAGDAVPNPLVEFAMATQAIEEFHYLPDHAAVAGVVAGRSALLWPSETVARERAHVYGTTLYLQALYDRLGRLPMLSVAGPAKEWARRFLAEKFGARPVIALHLKNKPGAINESNANFPAWAEFLAEAPVRHECGFVLVGNEPVPDSVRSLPHVVLAADHGSALCRDLALIDCAQAFMGMASGLCQMAMFGSKPYIVFKNPGHHAPEMQLELGDADGFNFSGRAQKLLRILDSQDVLFREFGDVLDALECGTEEART